MKDPGLADMRMEHHTVNIRQAAQQFLDASVRDSKPVGEFVVWRAHAVLEQPRDHLIMQSRLIRAFDIHLRSRGITGSGPLPFASWMVRSIFRSATEIKTTLS